MAIRERRRGDAAAMSLLLGCLLSAGVAAPLQPAIAQAALEQLPQQWLDDRAHDVRLGALKGHTVVLTMSYATCHRICPAALDEFRHLQQLADARHENVDFVVVGYDPANDGPGVWRHYRETRRLTRANWYFLTGSAAATQALAQQLGFPFWTMDEHVMHDARAIVFDSRGLQRAALGPPIARWADVF